MKNNNATEAPLSVTVAPIHEGTVPRPQGRMHRIRVDPWLATTLASFLDGLSFALHMPTGFATNADEIGHHKASIDANIPIPWSNFLRMMPFYNDAKTLDPRANKLLKNFFEPITSIIDGQAIPPISGTFHILTSIGARISSNRSIPSQ